VAVRPRGWWALPLGPSSLAALAPREQPAEGWS
jgi:hypothetical protein